MKTETIKILTILISTCLLLYFLLEWGYKNKKIKSKYELDYVILIEINYNIKANLTYYSPTYNFTDYEIKNNSSHYIINSIYEKYVNPADLIITSKKPYVSNKYILLHGILYFIILSAALTAVVYLSNLYEKRNYVFLYDVD